jgi:hypothetical protein
MGYAAVDAILAQNVSLVILSVGLLGDAWLSDFLSRKALTLVGTELAIRPGFDLRASRSAGTWRSRS